MPFFGDFLIVGTRPKWAVAYMPTGLLGKVFYDPKTKSYSWEKGTDIPGKEVGEAEERILVEKMIDAVKRWDARIQ